MLTTDRVMGAYGGLWQGGYGREAIHTMDTGKCKQPQDNARERASVSSIFGGLRGRDCPSQPSQRPPRPPQGVPNRPARARPQIPWAAAADAPPPESAHRSRKSPKTENVPTRGDVPKDPTGCPRPSPRSPGRVQAARTFRHFLQGCEIRGAGSSGQIP